MLAFVQERLAQVIERRNVVVRVVKYAIAVDITNDSSPIAVTSSGLRPSRLALSGFVRGSLLTQLTVQTPDSVCVVVSQALRGDATQRRAEVCGSAIRNRVVETISHSNGDGHNYAVSIPGLDVRTRHRQRDVLAGGNTR